MNITACFSGLTSLTALLPGQKMLRYAVGGSFVFIAAASVVALDDQRTWFRHIGTPAAVASSIAPPAIADTTDDSQPAIVFDRVAPPTVQVAAITPPVTDATPAPVVEEPAPVPVKLTTPEPVKVVAPEPAPVVQKTVAHDLPHVTPQQTNAPVFDNLLVTRQMLTSGDVDHAKALLVYLQARLGREPGREDVTIAKTMLNDAVNALDAGDTNRAVHKVNVATTCFTVHCPPPNAR